MGKSVSSFESVWATLDRVGERLDSVGAKLDQSGAEFDRKLSESRIKFDESIIKSRAEFDQSMAKSRAEFDKRMKKLDERIGGMANNNGLIAEEYFFNSFEKGQRNFFGEKFDAIKKNIKGIEKDDEYDILLINGQTIGIVEVKYKAHENDLPKVIKKAETFRENFPKYAGHRVYLGLATMAFYPELEQECINQGVAIIKQSGDSVIINDNHLRAF
jgi:hypothetical protein